MSEAPKMQKIDPKDLPPELAAQAGVQAEAPEVVSDDVKEAREKQFDFRMQFKKAYDSLDVLKRRLERVRSYEEGVLAREDLRQLVLAVLKAQHDALEQIESAYEKLGENLRDAFPGAKAPVILNKADREKWAIRVGFSWPDPTDPTGRRKIRYSPGEPIPDNMTEDEAEALWAQDILGQFRKGPDGRGLFYPHPRVKDLSPGQIDDFVGNQPLAYQLDFLRRNTFRQGTLLKMKVACAKFPVDERLKKEVDRLLSQFEA